MLSEEMKRFGEIAHIERIDFIKAKLSKESLLGFWQPIPMIGEEADHSLLTKSQFLSIINSLTSSFNDSERLRFRGLSNKSRDDLMNK